MRKYTEISQEETKDILSKEKGTRTDIVCPECSGYMIVRKGYSSFLGCSNYPKCDCKLGIVDNLVPPHIKTLISPVLMKDSIYRKDGQWGGGNDLFDELEDFGVEHSMMRYGDF